MPRLTGWVKFTYQGEDRVKGVVAFLVSSSTPFTVEPYPDDTWVVHVKQEFSSRMPKENLK